jgi:16S rRNA G966 N2-methylase RsmD
MNKKKIIKNKIFPTDILEDKNMIDKLMIDDDSVTYISTPQDADQITNIIKQHLSQMNLDPAGLTITDATAGVGGNVYSFATIFSYVNAIEENHERYKYLVNNCHVYKFKNVLSFCDNALNILFNISQQDIVFIDPPWGGGDYKKQFQLKLKLGDIDLEDLCNSLFDESKTVSQPYLICMKLPKNYDLKNLYLKLEGIKIYCYDLYNMYLIIMHK